MAPFAAVVIEDDPDHSRLIGMLLHDLGFTVHAAATGPEGVDAVRRLDPEVITTDLILPGFGGAGSDPSGPRLHGSPHHDR